MTIPKNFVHLTEEIVGSRPDARAETFLHSSRTNPGRVSKAGVPAHLKDKFNGEKKTI